MNLVFYDTSNKKSFDVNVPMVVAGLTSPSVTGVTHQTKKTQENANHNTNKSYGI